MPTWNTIAICAAGPALPDRNLILPDTWTTVIVTVNYVNLLYKFTCIDISHLAVSWGDPKPVIRKCCFKYMYTNSYVLSVNAND